MAYTLPAGVTTPAEIRAYQQKMNAAGASLAVDGKWGDQTQAAYKAYSEKEAQKATVQSLLDQAKNASANIGAAYDAAGSQYSAAANAAYNATKSNYESQQAKLGDQYDTVRNQAYVNARLKAVGNNEQLASQGLAGNMYDPAQSGVSETSRIAENTAMRNDINTATTQEQAAKDEIANAITQAGYTRDQQVAEQLASLATQKAQAQSTAESNSITQALQLMQYQNSLNQTTAKKSSGGTTTYRPDVMETAKTLIDMTASKEAALNNIAKWRSTYESALGKAGTKQLENLIKKEIQ